MPLAVDDVKMRRSRTFWAMHPRSLLSESAEISKNDLVISFRPRECAYVYQNNRASEGIVGAQNKTFLSVTEDES